MTLQQKQTIILRKMKRCIRREAWDEEGQWRIVAAIIHTLLCHVTLASFNTRIELLWERLEKGTAARRVAARLLSPACDCHEYGLQYICCQDLL